MRFLRNYQEDRAPRVAESPRCLCDAGRLLLNPDFQALYDDPGSPVVARIAALEAQVRDPGIADLPRIMALKGELEGFAFVRRALADMAEGQAKEAGAATAARPRSGLLPVRPS